MCVAFANCAQLKTINELTKSIEAGLHEITIMGEEGMVNLAVQEMYRVQSGICAIFQIRAARLVTKSSRSVTCAVPISVVWTMIAD
jgi:hypothetical protein